MSMAGGTGGTGVQVAHCEWYVECGPQCWPVSWVALNVVDAVVVLVSDVMMYR